MDTKTQMFKSWIHLTLSSSTLWRTGLWEGPQGPLLNLSDFSQVNRYMHVDPKNLKSTCGYQMWGDKNSRLKIDDDDEMETITVIV